MAIHFQLKNEKEYDSIAVEGPGLLLRDLKQAIIEKRNLTAAGGQADLEVVDLATKEGAVISRESCARCVAWKGLYWIKNGGIFAFMSKSVLIMRIVGRWREERRRDVQEPWSAD